MNPRAAGAAAMLRNRPRIRQGNPPKPFIPRTWGGSNDQSDPRGWQEGGVVDYASNFAAPWHRGAGTMENPSESLMNERARLQQLLQQTTDEAMAQEILMRIREITKELEMDVRNLGMAGGGLASLMGI